MYPSVTVYASGWKDRDLEVDLRLVRYDGGIFANTRKVHQEIRAIDVDGLTIVEFRDYIPSLDEVGRGYWFPLEKTVIRHLIEILGKAKTSAYDRIAGRVTKSPALGSDAQTVVRRIKQNGLDYVELRDYSKSTGAYGKGYWFPVSSVDALTEGLRVIVDDEPVPVAARRLIALRSRTALDEDVWLVRCGGCRQAVSLSPVQYPQRATVFCCRICQYEHDAHGNDATTESERNAQWEQIINVAGMTPLQVSRIWGVAHSLVYRTMDRIKDTHMG